MPVNLNQMIKQSIVYGYLFSQPFATYVDANPSTEQEPIRQTEQLISTHHNQTVRIMQKKANKHANVTIKSFYDRENQLKHTVRDFQAITNAQEETNLSTLSKNEEIGEEEDEKTVDEEMKETIAEKEERSAQPMEQVKVMEINEANQEEDKDEEEDHIKQVKKLAPEVYPWLISDEVTEIQKSLQFLDLYKGEIDGIYGPLTKEALEEAASLFDLDIDFTVPVQESVQETAVHETETVEKEKKDQPEAAKEEHYEVETVNSPRDQIINHARSLLGSPYVWGGDSPNGFDCSGFIQYIFQQEDITIPRTVSDIWNFSSPVDSPSIGDLVFFETYKAGPSHMGVYIGDDQFIHAGLSNGVVTANLSDSYWQERYLGAKRIH